MCYFYYHVTNMNKCLQVTSKKAALIETHGELKDKVGVTASISQGNYPRQLMS